MEWHGSNIEGKKVLKYIVKNKYKKFLADIYRLTTPLLIYLLFFSCFCSDRLYYLGGEKDEGIKGDVKINTEILIEDSNVITEDNIENSDDIIFDNNSLADINDTNYIDELAELESEEDAYFFDCVSDPLTDARVENICNTKIDLDVLTMEEMKPISQFYMGGWMNGIYSITFYNNTLYVFYSDGPEGNTSVFFVFGEDGELIYKYIYYNEIFVGPVIYENGDAYFSSGTNSIYNFAGKFFKYDKKKNSMEVLKEFQWYQHVSPIIDLTDNIIFFANERYDDDSGKKKNRRYIYKYRNNKFILEKKIEDGFYWSYPHPLVDNKNIIYARSVYFDSADNIVAKIESYDSDFNLKWEYDLKKHCASNDRNCENLKMISDGDNLYVLVSTSTENKEKIVSINRDGKTNWVFEIVKDNNKSVFDLIIDEYNNLIYFTRDPSYNGALEIGVLNRCGKLIRRKNINEFQGRYEIIRVSEGIKILSGNNVLFGGALFDPVLQTNLRFYAILDSELNLKKIYYYPTYEATLPSSIIVLNSNVLVDCKELIFLYPWATTSESPIKAFLYRVEFPDFALGKSPWPMERGDQKNTGRVQLYR